MEINFQITTKYATIPKLEFFLPSKYSLSIKILALSIEFWSSEIYGGGQPWKAEWARVKWKD